MWNSASSGVYVRWKSGDREQVFGTKQIGMNGLKKQYAEMYIQIVRPSDPETILGLPCFSSDTSDSFTFSDRDSDRCPRSV